ncbi:MAG: GTPase ObgE, partial [Pseudomonadota bacterium]
RELEAYGGALADKPRVTVLNKIDALDEEERAFLREELEAVVGGPVMMMSGVSREGVTDVLRSVRDMMRTERDRENAKTMQAEPWRP